MNKAPWQNKYLRLFFIVLFVLVNILACGSSKPAKIWVGRIVRDMDTTSFPKYEDLRVFKALYINEGKGVEKQSLRIIDVPIGWPVADVGYGNSGPERQELINLQGLRNPETYGFTTQEKQSENSLGITESSYSTMRWTTADNTPYIATKNELEYTFPGIQYPVGVESTYRISGTLTAMAGSRLEGTPWYDVIYQDTILGDSYTPYTAVIIPTGRVPLPANWAQSNETFDAATEWYKGAFDSLRENQWQDLDPAFGKLKLVHYNPTGMRDVLSFQQPFYGKIWTEDGFVINYRIKPEYMILDTNNLYFGNAKQNSSNGTLRSILWQIQRPDSDPNNDDSWETAAGMHFLKGRFANNGLYAFRLYEPGENYRDVIASLQAAMDSDIPQDVLDGPAQVEDTESGHALLKKIEVMVYNRKPWDMSEIVKDHNLLVGAIVRYKDISDTTPEKYACGIDNDSICVRTIVTVPRKELLWHLTTNEQGVETANLMLALLSKPAIKAFQIGYVEPGRGDGTSYILGTLNSYLRERANIAGYHEAIRLDQRAPNTPEMIDAATEAIFGQYREYWK